jgi:hypothetical protein
MAIGKSITVRDQQVTPPTSSHVYILVCRWPTADGISTWWQPTETHRTYLEYFKSLTIEEMMQTSIWDQPPGAPIPLVPLPSSANLYYTYGGKVVHSPTPIEEEPDEIGRGRSAYYTYRGRRYGRLRGGAGESDSEEEDESSDEEDGEPRNPALSRKTTIAEGRAIKVFDSRKKEKGVRLSMEGYLYDYRYHSTPTIAGEKTSADVYSCQYWRSGCPAKIWTKEGTADYLMETVAPHDHGADPVDIQRREVIEKAVDLLSVRPERKVRDVMTEALKDQPPAVLEALDHQNLRKRLSTLKTQLVGQPTGPTSPALLEIPEAYRTHHDGQPFVIVDKKTPLSPGPDGEEEADRLIIVTHPTMAKVSCAESARSCAEFIE